MPASAETVTCQRLLLPLDGSPESEAALEVAAALAGQTEGCLLSLVSYARDSVAAVARGHYLASVSERLQRAGLEVSWRVLREGGVSLAVLRESQKSAAQLILLSTRGRSRMERWLLGSHSEEIIRGASCPVLVLNLGARLRPGKILITLDGSVFSERVLEPMTRWASQTGMAVTLLTVCCPPLAHEQPQAMSAYLEGLRSGLERRGVVCSQRLAFGDPAPSIVEIAREDGFDLVVLVSHGRQGRDRFWLGSVAESVMRHNECATLIWK